MTTIAELRDGVRGPVIEPGDDGFEEHRRVYNFMHDRRPAVIVRATSTADVVAAVNYARSNNLDLAVRGGGHSVPGFGTCDDGLVLDLSLIEGALGLIEDEARRRDGEPISFWVPLADAVAVRYLLGRGYRVDPDPLYLLEDPPRVAADRYVVTSPPFFL